MKPRRRLKHGDAIAIAFLALLLLFVCSFPFLPSQSAHSIGDLARIGPALIKASSFLANADECRLY